MKNKSTKYRIRVTQKDINNGDPCEPYSCPVALALKRKFPDDLVEVTGGELGDIQIGESNQWKASPAVNKFITDFDSSCKSVKPFRFTLTKLS